MTRTCCDPAESYLQIATDGWSVGLSSGSHLKRERCIQHHYAWMDFGTPRSGLHGIFEGYWLSIQIRFRRSISSEWKERCRTPRSPACLSTPQAYLWPAEQSGRLQSLIVLRICEREVNTWVYQQCVTSQHRLSGHPLPLTRESGRRSPVVIPGRAELLMAHRD